MRPWLLLIIGGLLAGCVQLQPPTDKSDMSWQQFGEQWALKGYIVEPETKLRSKVPDVTASQYKAYLKGYQEGKSEYCKQDPFVLGRNGKIYYGICNDVDRMYLDEYWRGKNARAKR
ncbi:MULTISPECIES: DUF2799 domain-containing protein [Vibrio]|uniref:DUF2799 domain-containing protein n=2 Tax=Vibrionaceae TaxID=641 RepID=A0A2S9ZJ51_9VIBR|nr:MULTISPECIES: DUF2799 domain-containing protein [Vibrio]AYV21708.1 DUF2799 domain-containing protein [Vibrio mediterranei]EDL52537.1 hypothetical protein VSAK1_01859 [Vibrio mediterranei AK1]KFA96118.1 hypothetical protein HW45_19280 [Vibrio sp. ER1A]MCG9657210.1 DUF2799 domain-containing protein [Vibrio mediterranei]MCG9785645.1 DUF2799 domain-containing protein [Vibrio mediterranei]